MTGDKMARQLMSVGQRLAISVKSLPVTWVRKLIFALIGLWVLAIALQLMGLVMTAETAAVSDDDSQALTSRMLPVSAAEVATLQQAQLFGEAGAAPTEVAKPTREDIAFNASKTQLDLALKGIIHTPDDAESVAVIVSRGQQAQYYGGDKLPVGSHVILTKVLLDHVILNNAGRYESLWLYDEEKNGKQTVSGRPAVSSNTISKRREVIVTDMRDDDKVTSLANDYRDKLYKNPRSLAEVLRILPAQEQGQLVGYRVSPGKDKVQFSQLGFKSNDIVTSVNGIVLDEPAKALEIYKLMRTAMEATFTVDRNGTSVEVLVSLQDNLGSNE